MPNNTPHQVPITLVSNIIADHNASAAVSDLPLTLSPIVQLQRPDMLGLIVSPAEEVYNRRIHLRRDPVRPASRVEEIARRQEVDKERVRRRDARDIHITGQWADQARRLLEMGMREADLLVDVHSLLHLIEILDADRPAGAEPVLAVIRPAGGVQSKARAVVEVVQRVVDVEAAHEHDLPANLAQTRDAVLGEPALGVGGNVVVVQDLGELLVGGLSDALALEGYEDGLARIPVEEGRHLVEQVAEVFVSSERDGEGGVHEDQAVGVGIVGVLGLHADVEEADAVVELLGKGDRLAAHGGEGCVVSRRVVGAGDGER